MVPGPPVGLRRHRRWAVLPAAVVLLVGCTSTPTGPTPTAGTGATAAAQAGATPAAQAPETPAGTSSPAPTAGPTDSGDPTDTGDLTYTADGGPVTLVSDSFTGALPGYRITDGTDTLDAPTALAVAEDDSVLYAITGDGASAQLIRLTDGMDRWEIVDDDGADLDQPQAVALGPDDTVAVVNGGTGTLSIGRDRGTTWSVVDPAAGRFDRPSAVGIAASGALFVSDAGDDTVSTSTDGGTTWTVVEKATGAFDLPIGVAAGSPDGTVYVLNGGDASLSVLRPGSTDWETIPAQTPGWSAPGGLATGPAGELYVADPGSGSLFRSLDGGRTWTSSDGFDTIAGLGVGKDGEVFLSDGINTLVSLQPSPGAVTGLTVAPASADGRLTVTWDAPAVSPPDVEFVVSAQYAPTRAELQAQRDRDGAETAQGTGTAGSTAGSDPGSDPDADQGPAPVVTEVVGHDATSATLTGPPGGGTGTVVVVARSAAGSGPAAQVEVGTP